MNLPPCRGIELIGVMGMASSELLSSRAFLLRLCHENPGHIVGIYNIPNSSHNAASNAIVFA